MALNDLLDRVKHYFAGRTPPSAEQVRQEKANLVLRLQEDVRRLQHEIAEIGNAADGGTANGERLASLYRDLEQKQAELARYHGRV
jgi:hypothetical protein